MRLRHCHAVDREGDDGRLDRDAAPLLELERVGPRRSLVDAAGRVDHAGGVEGPLVETRRLRARIPRLSVPRSELSIPTVSVIKAFSIDMALARTPLLLEASTGAGGGIAMPIFPAGVRDAAARGARTAAARTATGAVQCETRGAAGQPFRVKSELRDASGFDSICRCRSRSVSGFTPPRARAGSRRSWPTRSSRGLGRLLRPRAGGCRSRAGHACALSRCGSASTPAVSASTTAPSGLAAPSCRHRRNTPRQAQLLEDLGAEILCRAGGALANRRPCPRDPSRLSLRAGVFGAEPSTKGCARRSRTLALTAINIYGLSEVMGPRISAGISPRRETGLT